MDTRDIIFETEDRDGNPVLVTYTIPTEYFHPEMTEAQAEEVAIGVEWTKELKTDESTDDPCGEAAEQAKKDMSE